MIEGICCEYCNKQETAYCPIKTASPWSRWSNFCSEYDGQNKHLLERSDNSGYAKCLDELWEHVELNAKNGSFIKSSLAEILKKHFA